MITARAYGHGEVKEIDPASISSVLGDGELLLWVDVADPSDEDLHCLQEEFSLHPLAMEDVTERHQRPKIETYPSHCFVVAYSADLQEVDLFVGPTWLITVRESNVESTAWQADGARTRFERVAPERPTAAFLLYILLDELVDGYFDDIDEAEEALEGLEDRIFGEQLADEKGIQQTLFDMRRRLLLFRRSVVPLREVLASLLRGEVEWVDDETLTHLQDVYDHVLRVVDLLDGQRELLGNAVEAHLAIISNRINAVMKRMTSWGAILLGSTLVAGIYGMNFQDIPELGWVLGYPFALMLMLLITVGGYFFFKRKDWL